MSTYILFCTSAISDETINTLLSQPEVNPFVLARGPEQTEFDNWNTEPPISSFQTGFLGWNAQRLQDYLTNDWPKFASGCKTNISRDKFAVLDQQSLQDETVVLYQLLSDSMTRMPTEDIEDEIQDREQHWWSWRVKFSDAETMIDSLETLDPLPAFCQEEFVGEDGVFDFRKAEEAYSKMASGSD